MGLWVAIRNATLESMERNLDELGYITWKADFDYLANRGDYEQRTAFLSLDNEARLDENSIHVVSGI